MAHRVQSPGGNVKDKERDLKRLELRRETLRTLVDSHLAKVAGGWACRSRAYSGCGTNNMSCGLTAE
jgi:hypothetical protein